MPALAGQLARALPTVDPVSNMSAHPAPFWLIRCSGPSFALMLVTAAGEAFDRDAVDSKDVAGPVAAADPAGPAESPARLTNLREIPATRGRLLRFGSLLSLMLVTAAREPCPADAAGPAESPARLTNLSAISAVRGGSARFGPLFALMLVTRAARSRSRSREGNAGMSA
ncbi:hypothetical protein C5E13_18005 [Pseudoclavibacter sp. RFBI4]|nr:hypothetical protein C5C19_01200 [Pseudoclavibacter sp. RFBH5]PPG18909.1 hypothetical protein C5E13_18005 [Pseudoclavibacter sp. RFBI4]